MALQPLNDQSPQRKYFSFCRVHLIFSRVSLATVVPFPFNQSLFLEHENRLIKYLRSAQKSRRIKVLDTLTLARPDLKQFP